MSETINEKESMTEEQSKISAENLKKFEKHKFSYKKNDKEVCEDSNSATMNNAELYCIETVRNEGDFEYSIRKGKDSEYVLIINDKNADIPGRLSSKDVFFAYNETEKTLSFKINNKEWVMK